VMKWQGASGPSPKESRIAQDSRMSDACKGDGRVLSQRRGILVMLTGMPLLNWRPQLKMYAKIRHTR